MPSRWGYFTPGASTDPLWLSITRAFQDGELTPAPWLPHCAVAVVAVWRRDGTQAWFERRETQRDLVLEAPGGTRRWVGRLVYNTDRWAGPGAPASWLLYDGNTVLALDPANLCVRRGRAARPDAFHISGIPPGFRLLGQTTAQLARCTWWASLAEGRSACGCRRM